MLATVSQGSIAAASPGARISKPPVWQQRLSDIFWVNSVAISGDGGRVAAGTFIHDYKQKDTKFLPNVRSRFGTHCFDATGKELWFKEFDGWDGVFGVAISGDGAVVAASGWLDRTAGNMADTGSGLLRAFDGTTGDPLLDFKGINQRVSWVSLSKDGNVLAAVADDVYVFQRADGGFDPKPLTLGIANEANRYVTSVAVHPDGTWLAACDKIGNVYMSSIQKDRLDRVFTWSSASVGPKLPFLSVAIAEKSGHVVVGGGNSVLRFDFAAIRGGGNLAPLSFDTSDGQNTPPARPDGTPQENVRWVATSADSTLVTAVANRNNSAGALVALDTNFQARWTARLLHNPNSTSIDAAGKYVTMCDGFPTGSPADFCLFDPANGQELWHFETCNMNWPMAISTDGTAIAGGSDDGRVNFFRP
jgi:hypothetical protein